MKAIFEFDFKDKNDFEEVTESEQGLVEISFEDAIFDSLGYDVTVKYLGRQLRYEEIDGDLDD